MEATTFKESRRSIATHGQQSERLLWMKRDLDPRAREELISRYLPFARNLASRYLNGRESFDDLAEHTVLGTEVIDRVSVARQERLPVSLEGEVTDDGESRTERIGNEDPGYEGVENADEMRFAMNKLGETERLVMRLRFIDEMTQSEIAERVGCSQMHISRMLRKSVGLLAETTTQP